MVQPSLKTCDETLVDRYLNSDLSQEKEDVFLEHLKDCPRCQKYIDTLRGFEQRYGDLVDHNVQAVDFTALEKDVLTTVIHHPFSHNRGSVAVLLTKIFLPLGLLLGMLILLAYLYLAGFFGH